MDDNVRIILKILLAFRFVDIDLLNPYNGIRFSPENKSTTPMEERR
jgi:hypothetical protein